MDADEHRNRTLRGYRGLNRHLSDVRPPRDLYLRTEPAMNGATR
ncbi:hypothetical protein FHS29_007052 [Saccharothrix tamanrassetensis]|uniref:Uncharacterized protein n=1 Tax=Saccharothrix tamanrassetensis TaxID=1051531 RepID=A0A841CWD0_9PSEU|nr:hypothetical protein [Saccharothrix tamanrassetensis]MBB5960428.1 hypothetical protein [Saccharothrix tamanrassetensis]